ncbi:SCP-like extracellular [Erythrobacter sp. KY5]|uniref:CAP domain-containing protein n=1 Tax=Erythrobacter sp. KY5 TaxID=2011159 RepID=UPI000DBEFD7D|nr:CAP domain-containing protein [Erythrobacter sp. KY5]AWW74748.1 SCP-like extracellular [Erythrobacter sp. KY5]
MRVRATILGLFAGLSVLGSAPAGADEGSWLDAHNAARAEFGVAPLSWSRKLEREARAWAEVLADEERIRHAPPAARGGTGENLWMGTAGYFTAHQMIVHLASEKQHFRSGTFPQVSRTGNWADVGHYTQMVWASTREVGCASARSARFDVLVCRYWPAGNVIGERIAPSERFARR